MHVVPISNSLRYHLEQLARLCSDHPVEPKIVFVPSRQIGHNIGTALALAGISWVHLHLTTPSDWARRLAAPRLKADGWKPIVQDAELFFLADIFCGVKCPAGQPIGDGVSATRLARTFQKTIRSLRMADVQPDEFAAADITLSGHRIIVDLYGAYCEWLEESRMYDDAFLFREARSRPQQSGIVAVLDETPLHESALRFIQSLSESVFRIGRPEYGTTGPQHSAFERLKTLPYWKSERAIGAGGKLLTSGVNVSDRDDLQLREAIGEENEVKGVLREYLRRGIRLDEIELVYTSERSYLPLIFDLTERLDLPATFAAGVPVAFTRPGQVLIGFYRWIADGLDPAVLVRILRSRLLFLREDRVGRVSDTAGLAQFVLEARVGPGRAGWMDALESLQRRAREEAPAGTPARRSVKTRRLKAIRKTKAILKKLYGLVPPSEEASVGEMAEAGIRLLATLSLQNTRRDQRAADSLTDRLLELVDGGSAVGRVSDLASSFVDLFSEHKVEAAVARPGSLYVVPLERAGYSGRKETAVVGLSETTFPGVVLEDPVLLDDERAHLSGRLVLQHARASEPVWHLIRVLGMAASRVTLTANRRDIMEGRETFPCAIFEQLKLRLEVPTPTLYNIVPEAEATLTGDESALALRGNGTVICDILNERPWLGDGLRASRDRASSALGIFDGWLGRETPELRPGAGSVISTSRLEELAACPHRYFLRHVLHVRPPDIPDETPGRWLTPVEFGSLLHEVLKTFMERVSERREAISVERHAEEIADVLQMHVERYQRRIPVRYEAGYQLDLKRLQRAVLIFLTEESRRNVTPLGFEVSFGLGKSNGLAVPDPIPLKLGDEVELLLRGTIDRIDQTEDGFEVWDYKSGSAFDFGGIDMLTGGRRLQWALYAYALDELLDRAGIDGRTNRAGYFFPSDRELGVRLSEQPPEPAVLGARLAPLFDLVEKGAFLHVQKHGACTHCDYNSICSRERIGRNDLEVAFDKDDPPPYRDALSAWMSV